jgi:hypothetical protein
MIEALFWMAAGAAFYHFCPKVARAIWSQLKKLGDVKLPF